jgi:hypothetical protein
MILGPSGGNDMLRQASRSLAGGLSKVGAQPFAGQAFANSMGGALEGGNSYEDQQFKDKLGVLDRALKNKQIDARIDSADDLADTARASAASASRRPIRPAPIRTDACARRARRCREGGRGPSRIALNNRAAPRSPARARRISNRVATPRSASVAPIRPRKAGTRRRARTSATR